MTDDRTTRVWLRANDAPPAIPHQAVLAAGIVMGLSAGAFAQDAPQGRYDGTYGGDGVLTVDVRGAMAEVSVARPGCLGMVEGQLSDLTGGSWAVTTTAYGACTLVLSPVAQGYAITQGTGCTVYHGAACDFSGTVEKAD
ncbi:MAG: hypothetical protein AB8B82_17160 [Roseovarius sp.]